MDLEKKECHEIPDIDFDLMTNIYNIMSPKLKRDMAALGNKTIQQLLEELFGEQLNKTPIEMYTFVYISTMLMTEYLKKIRMGLEHADDMLFVDYVCRHIREHNWDDVDNSYLKWKKYKESAWDLLMEKQEQELKKYLKKGMNQIYDYHFYDYHFFDKKLCLYLIIVYLCSRKVIVKDKSV